MGASDFVQAEIAYTAVAPMLIVFGGAMVGVLVEAFAPRSRRYGLQLTIAVLAIVAALVQLLVQAREHHAITAGGSVAVDGVSVYLQATLLGLTLLSVLLMAERFAGSAPETFTQDGASVPGSRAESDAVRLGATTTEVFPLTLFALGGMMLFTAADDLLTLFVALEVLSLPLYVLTGLARRRRLLSQEAALKYFLLGAFSSAFFLFGAALIYGVTGTVQLGAVASAIATGSGMDALLVTGIVLIAVGLLFKVSAVPFHSWAPDVYQGAPTPVTGFMAACTKIAAFGATARVFYIAFEGMRWTWQPVLAVIALLTMVVGAVLTVTQTDVKRLLAYSSITHAGFLLLGVVAMSRASVSGLLFYLTCYGLTTIAAFGLVTLVRSGGNEATHLSQWAGLARRSPVVAATLTFLMAAFAGIPLTSGFTAKYALFAPALAHGAAWLVVVAVVVSAITAFAYFRLMVLMYFSDPAPDVEVLTPSVLTVLAVAVGTVLTLVLGILPTPLLDLAHDASLFLR